MHVDGETFFEVKVPCLTEHKVYSSTENSRFTVIINDLT